MLMYIDVLEKVQRRFTRILPNYRHLPYISRLKCYNLSSLYARRLFFDLLHVFKIVRALLISTLVSSLRSTLIREPAVISIKYLM